jgi:hypothetical protein
MSSLGLLLLMLPQDLSRETVTIPGSGVKFTLVRLPGGKLSPFWIGTHEVTWDEYSLYYNVGRKERLDGVTRPSQPDVVDPKEPFPNGAPQGGTHPAISIGWFGAVGYCEWLSRKTGQKYRLPTEAEWEYACHAEQPLDDRAWFKENSGGHSHEVGQKKPNAFGLYDILGNVWENCLEPYGPPAHGDALRGGGWNTPVKDLRATGRQNVPDDWSERDPKKPLRLWWITDGKFVGLRLVRVDGGEMKAQEKFAAQVEVRDLKVVKAGNDPDYFDRVTGEIVYSGDKPLDEVEVTVFFLDEGGKPMMTDPKDKPSFNLVYPVMGNSWHEGGHRKPLQPGERRKFELDVPHPFIEAGALSLDKVGAKVSYVHVVR